MTIDSIVLYVGIYMDVACRSWASVVKFLAWTPVLGPGAALCWVTAEMVESSVLLAVDVG